MFNRPRPIRAENVDLGDKFVVNGQKYRVAGVGSNATLKFIWLILADYSSKQVLELRVKLDTVVYVKKK